MRNLPPLTALRAFEAAARHRSFKRAAGELALTPTAISHQVRQLEDRLGLALFERRPRQVALTEAGRRLFPALRDGFDTMATAVDSLRAGAARPLITLTTTRAFATRWLLPRLAGFAAAAPDIDLHVHASDQLADLAAGRVDLAVRYGAGPWPDLQSEPLLRGRFAPVCSPSLGVRAPSALAGQRLIDFDWAVRDTQTPDWTRWWRAAGLRGTPPAPHLRFADETHAIQAAIAGQGIALASLALVADEIAQQRLVVPFGPMLDGHPFQLVWATPAGRTDAHARVRTWLATEARP